MPENRQTSSSEIVRLEAVSVSFGAFLALDDVSLSLKAESRIALLGTSGCGKTTLLRVLTGALVYTGECVISAPTAMVYQDLKLLPWLTVRNNILLGRSESSESYLDELLDIAGIADKDNSYPYQLSGGQRQRVSIVRALVGLPKLLLLDEPFSALDFLAKRKLIEFVQKLQAERKLTSVIVTHDIEDALALSDQIVVMRNGRIAGHVFVDGNRQNIIDEIYSKIQG